MNCDFCNPEGIGSYDDDECDHGCGDDDDDDDGDGDDGGGGEEGGGGVGDAALIKTRTHHRGVVGKNVIVPPLKN